MTDALCKELGVWILYANDYRAVESLKLKTEKFMRNRSYSPPPPRAFLRPPVDTLCRYTGGKRKGIGMRACLHEPMVYAKMLTAASSLRGQLGATINQSIKRNVETKTCRCRERFILPCTLCRPHFVPRRRDTDFEPRRVHGL